ncbi:MAG: hypothetical protein ABIA76_02405 [Candidatus Diapherotrites archaeon]
MKRTAFERLNAVLQKEKKLEIAGAQVNYSAQYVKKRSKYYKDAVALLRFLRETGAHYLDGKLYAIRRNTASKVQLPSDPRILEDYFLQMLFAKKIKIVQDAVVVGRFPDEEGLENFLVRHEVSKRLLRQNPEYENFLLKRDRIKIAKAITVIPEALIKLGPLRVVRILRTHSRLRRNAKGRADSLMQSNADSWGKIHSTKLSKTKRV